MLCNSYVNSKLSNRFYKFKPIAFVFIPFLSQPDTDDLDSGFTVCLNVYVKILSAGL